MKRSRRLKSGVYKIINTINGKCYIGSSVNIKKRFAEHYYVLKNNISHSIKLQRAWNKYGEFVFKFEVILYCGKEDLMVNEQKMIDQYEAATIKGYNTNPTAYSQLGYIHSEETKQKISISNTGKVRTEEEKIQMSIRISGNKNPNFERVFSDEYRRKIGVASSGRVCAEETRRKIGEASKGNQYSKGVHPSEETRQKLSKVHKGILFTDDHKEKLSISKLGNKNPQYGIPISDETKRKITEANSGTNHHYFGKHRSEEVKRKISETLKQKNLKIKQCQ